MVVDETLERRAQERPITEREARDYLVAWFMKRAERQIRAGMKFTAPGAGIEELQRVSKARARSFFLGLASTWDAPTFAALRRVQKRMATWLLPRRETAGAIDEECESWQRLLAR